VLWVGPETVFVIVPRTARRWTRRETAKETAANSVFPLQSLLLWSLSNIVGNTIKRVPTVDGRDATPIPSLTPRPKTEAEENDQQPQFGRRQANPEEDSRLGREDSVGPSPAGASHVSHWVTKVQFLPGASREQWIPGDLRDQRRYDDCRRNPPERGQHLRPRSTARPARPPTGVYGVAVGLRCPQFPNRTVGHSSTDEQCRSRDDSESDRIEATDRGTAFDSCETTTDSTGSQRRRQSERATRLQLRRRRNSDSELWESQNL
jgi:hypothetical protein